MNFHQPPVTFVGSVHLLVEDLERSLVFYQKLLGFQIIERKDKRAILTTDGITPLLVLEQPDNVLRKQPKTTGLYHFALLLPNRSDLAGILLHLIKSGYPLQGASDHLVSEALYLADPDGNGIEIYIDRPSDSWDWKNGEVVMTTEPLDVNNLLSEGKELFNLLPSGTVMGHIHLHVSELQKTKEFYCKGLGFDVALQYSNHALFISSGGYHHHIGLNIWNGAGAPAPHHNSVGLKWYSIIYPNEQSRNEAITRINNLGYEVKDENGVFTTKDPSSNHIHLLV